MVLEEEEEEEELSSFPNMILANERPTLLVASPTQPSTFPQPNLPLSLNPTFHFPSTHPPFYKSISLEHFTNGDITI